ncbi:pantetheine-phosphate adenylyltransferase [Actinotalea sp.]|uniref:pantetheine-phosphate adenylyltransferase n=1 Tax=Actinotalea sp. TaxID=1872145 RepID=UPI00356B5ACB
MSIAVCPGSFDPITLGHLDVIRRGSALVDEVVVAVATNAGKQPLLSLEERVDLARRAVADLPGVRVEAVGGLLVDYCRSIGASVLLKGLRNGADYDAELPMALMNRHLTGIETVFLPADRSAVHIASSLVKDVARHGGPIDDLVPEGVAEVVRARWAERAEQDGREAGRAHG